MNTKSRKFLEQFIKEHGAAQGYSEKLDELFSDYLTENFSGIIVEDHENRMTASEMAKHIKKLYKMCEDESIEKKFLKHLGKAVDVDNCSEKDIKKCAERLCKENDAKCDDVIHELEDMVDYAYDEPDDEDEDNKKSEKKLDEATKGSIIRKGNEKMVVLDNLGGGDVRAARIHHGKPLYRTSTLVRSGYYVDTGEKIKINEPVSSRERDPSSGGFEDHSVSL